MSDSSSTSICPKCGGALPRDAPRGLCVKCLFAALFEGGPLNGVSAAAIHKVTLPRVFGSYELIEEVARGQLVFLTEPVIGLQDDLIVLLSDRARNRDAAVAAGDRDELEHRH